MEVQPDEKPNGKAAEVLSVETLVTLAEIGEEINSSLDLDIVLEKTAALVKRLIDYEIFSVMLLDPESQRLYHHFAIGYPQIESKFWRIPVGQGITELRQPRDNRCA